MVFNRVNVILEKIEDAQPYADMKHLMDGFASFRHEKFVQKVCQVCGRQIALLWAFPGNLRKGLKSLANWMTSVNHDLEDY